MDPLETKGYILSNVVVKALEKLDRYEEIIEYLR